MEQESRSLAAEAILADIERDPSLAAGVASAYSGRHGVLDALWWLAHPGTAAPSGRPDPALELNGLRAARFSREGQSSEFVDMEHPETGETVRMRSVEARVLECERRLAEDAAAVDAVIQAHRPSRGGSSASPAAGAAADSVAAEPAHVIDAGSPAPSPAPAASPRARTLVPVLFASGLVVGALLTWSLSSGGFGVEPARLPASSGEADPTSGPGRALAVFDRPATQSDLLPDEFFLAASQVSGRLLYVDMGLKVWTYRDRGDICLFLQDGEAAAGTCTTTELFSADGITLPLPDHGVAMTNGSNGTPTPALTELTWSPDGAIEIRATSLLP